MFWKDFVTLASEWVGVAYNPPRKVGFGTFRGGIWGVVQILPLKRSRPFTRPHKYHKSIQGPKVVLEMRLKWFQLENKNPPRKVGFETFRGGFWSDLPHSEVMVTNSFPKNVLFPTGSETYPKHNSKLLLSSENDSFKVGRKMDKLCEKKNNCLQSQGFGWSNSRLDSYM